MSQQAPGYLEQRRFPVGPIIFLPAFVIETSKPACSKCASSRLTLVESSPIAAPADAHNNGHRGG